MALLDIEPEVSYLGFDDIDGQRKSIYDSALKGFDGKLVENDQFKVQIVNPRYKEDYMPRLKDEKQAIHTGGTLARKLYGEVQLIDKATNQVLDQKETMLAQVPHLNQRGMFIRNGSAWIGRSQQRLRSGIYARKGSDGTYSAMINAKRGRGMNVQLDPNTGVFKLNVGQSTTRLLPLLRQMGVPDDEIKASWGEDLFNRNFRQTGAQDSADIQKVVKLLGKKDENTPQDKLKERLLEILDKTELDDEVTESTLGEKIPKLSPQALVKVTKRILAVANGAEEDNRDSQAYQSTHGPDDIIRERLQRDQAGALRKILWNATADKTLKRLGSGAFSKNIDALFQGSGLFVGTEDINPVEITDLRQAVVRTGEGGISSEAVSREARGVHPSQLGLIDPSRTPDSGNIGLDLRVAGRAVKGSDNKLYTPVIDTKTGETVHRSAIQMAKSTVAFPGEMEKESKRVRALKNGQLTWVRKEEVDYTLPSAESMYSRTTGVVPLFEGIKGQRLLMGVKATTQSLPLRDGEAPLVQTGIDGGKSLHSELGIALGAIRAKQPGKVLSVDKDEMKVQYADGSVVTHDLFNNYAHSRKTMTHNTPLVKPGDVVRPGQTLAKSNYTDNDGVLAMGKNLRTGWMQYHGNTFEDAIVVSESAAKKLTSEHLYKHDIDFDGLHSTKKADFVQIYGPKFKKEQYANLDDEGVVKEGQIVNPGDPVLLAVGKKSPRAVGAVMQSERSNFSDKSQIWDHKWPGEVTDVVRTKDGVRVTVKSFNTSSLSDKLSSVYGNKGVISKIIPDDQMPHDENGQPLEVIFNANGLVSRTNPAVAAAALLGKVAAKTGKKYVLPPFGTAGEMSDFALEEARKAGVKELENLTDPVTGRTLPNVFTGTSYIVKMHHVADSKLSARDTGAYDIFGTPAKGGFGGSKRVGGLDSYSLVSHGATEFLKDAKLIRGQKNESYWRALKNGETPVGPTKTFANDHFKALLTAAGVNLKEDGSKTQLSALLDTDVRAKAAHEITSGETFNWETNKPIEGGLFDPKATGGADGTQWARIKLPRPVPHPLFVTPITKMLGITSKNFDEVLAGKARLGNSTGPEAVIAALENIKPDQEIDRLKNTVRSAKGVKRDDAVKALGYLTGLQKQGVKPSDLMITEIPVIPPKYRPVARTATQDITHDLNYLYHDILEAKSAYKDAGDAFGKNDDEYLNMVKAVQALPGMGEPVGEKSKEQEVKGVLAFAVGKGDSPKNAVFQRRVVSSVVDTVGRAAITAAPELDMDQIRVPREMAWTMFKPFIIKDLVSNGKPAQEAVMAVRERKPEALETLKKVMNERHVVYNRAPSLHKYSYVGGKAVLGTEDDDSIGINYVVEKGMGSDHDGDSCRTVLTVRCEVLDWVQYQGTNPMPINTAQVTTYEGPLYIQDLPVVESSAEKLSENVTNYRINGKVDVCTLDPVTMEPKWYPVTDFSVHEKCQTRVVEFMGVAADTVTVTEDHSLITYVDGRLVPTKPDEIGKLCVPVVKKLGECAVDNSVTAVGKHGHHSLQGASKVDVQWEDKRLTLQLDATLGFFIGSLVGDGWVACNDQIYLANNEQVIRDKFEKSVYELGITQHCLQSSFAAMSLGDKMTERGRVRFNCAWFARWLRSHIGEGALNKKLPSFAFNAPADFVVGLLDGLFSTDGTLCFTKAKSKNHAQFSVQYSTSSVDLLDGLKALMRRFGVRVSHSTYKSRVSGKDAYTVVFSATDFMKFVRANNFTVTHPEKLANLTKALELVPSETQEAQRESSDVVPFPSQLATILNNACRCAGFPLGETSTAGASSKGSWTRANARRALAFIKVSNLHFPTLCRNNGNAAKSLDPVKATQDLLEYEQLLNNEDVTWQQVKKVTAGPEMVCYDLTVPGPFTFTTHTGVVLQDTINIHVPVSDAANKEVKEKLLPSKTLLSAATGESHYEPQQDYVVGLYLASQIDDKKEAKTFRNEQEAMSAYSRGEISLSDPIKILQHG
jgi:DNA-directed RNA polymerase beta subunit/DNA-directed RNA polymerase beta' subunit